MTIQIRNEEVKSQWWLSLSKPPSSGGIPACAGMTIQIRNEEVKSRWWPSLSKPQSTGGIPACGGMTIQGMNEEVKIPWWLSLSMVAELVEATMTWRDSCLRRNDGTD